RITLPEVGVHLHKGVDKPVAAVYDRHYNATEASYSCRRNATRSCFFGAVSFNFKMMLKNSTVSSSVRHRPSCMYGGHSFIPRNVNVLIGPSPGSSLMKRSMCRSCI